MRKLRLRHEVKEVLGVIFLYALIVGSIIILSFRIG